LEVGLGKKWQRRRILEDFADHARRTSPIMGSRYSCTLILLRHYTFLFFSSPRVL
jgi:hypothetical protein